MSAAHAQGVGSLASDRARLAEITGSTDSTLPSVRPFGAAFARIPGFSRTGIAIVEPDVRITWNSQLPFSGNDGPLWAGRGWNAAISAGLTARRRIRSLTIQATLAPAVSYSQNLPFAIVPATVNGRSAYAAPFHDEAHSIDLPMRFGDEHLLVVDAGRSEFTVSGGALVVGIAATTETWGPGIRNALVMSGNAPGVPRLFVGTAQPLRTRAGALEAKLIAGTLTESLLFDTIATNNWRSLSGVLVQLRPAFDSTLTFGLARAVYTPVRSTMAGVLERGLSALTRWESIAVLYDTLPNGRPRQGSDQITSAFARWIFPASGFEVYGEWARMDLPRSGSELLVAPHHAAGYTLGFQWARPRRVADFLRLQSEITYLEQSLVFPARPSPDFYNGVASPQGYTHRGQLLGAVIGPGSSSQWVAVDWFTPRSQLGLFISRIRWDNDALYRQGGPNFFRHDVTMFGGVRAGRRSPVADLHVELSWSHRFNYLFQNGFASPGGFRTVDVHNVTLALSAAPR